jgi:SAM-dependent methyltransferase
MLNRLRRANPLTRYKYEVGGLWDEMGRHQFGYLVEQGLQPSHYMLDVGCGSLRGGRHFIKYLEPGHYFGLDISDGLLNAGRAVIRREALEKKRPTLLRSDQFEFDRFERYGSFDVALAQSVFTHLPMNSVLLALLRIQHALRPGGRFFATFFENPAGRHNAEPVSHKRADGPDFDTHFDRDPYHYDLSTFDWMVDGTVLDLEYLGDWRHPRDQRMLLFTRRDSTAG